MDQKPRLLIVLPSYVHTRRVLISSWLSRLASNFQLILATRPSLVDELSRLVDEIDCEVNAIPEVVLAKHQKQYAYINRIIGWVENKMLLKNAYIETLHTNFEVEKQKSPYKYWVFNTLWRFLFSSSRMRRLLIDLRARYMNVEGASKFMRANAPDILLVEDIFAPGHQHIIRIANVQKILRIGVVRSWDNLSSKGAIIEPFSYYFVWNQDMENELLTYYSTHKQSQIYQVGVLEHEILTRLSTSVVKNAFRFGEQLAGRRVITFMLSYPDAKPDYLHHVILLIEAIKAGRVKGNPVLVVRAQPGPRSKGVEENLAKYGDGILVDIGPSGVKVSGIEEYLQDFYHYWKLLEHTDIVVNTTSTTTIDAALINRPNVTINFDKNPDEPYLSSIRRLMDRTHYQWVKSCGGNYIVENPEELFDAINLYFDNPQRDEIGRSLIVKRLTLDSPGNATEMHLNAILDIAKQNGVIKDFNKANGLQ